MKNDIVSKIDRYIDNDLYAFPYIDDVKEALEDKEREQIASYAQNLKKALKFINANISRQEREKLDFNPRHIKKMFDSITLTDLSAVDFNDTKQIQKISKIKVGLFIIIYRQNKKRVKHMV